MKKQKKTTGGKKHMTNEDVVRILMQEIADVRLELKADIGTLKLELKEDIGILKKEVSTVKNDLGVLRIEVHQNHASFMKYQGVLDKRVTRLEAKVG